MTENIIEIEEEIADTRINIVVKGKDIIEEEGGLIRILLHLHPPIILHQVVLVPTPLLHTHLEEVVLEK